MIDSFPLYFSLLLGVIIAGYVVRPFEKRAEPNSPIHSAKWILLTVFLFLLLQGPVQAPIVLVAFLVLSGVGFLGLFLYSKIRKKKLEFTSITVSNLALILLASLGLLVLIIYIIFTNAVD